MEIPNKSLLLLLLSRFCYIFKSLSVSLYQLNSKNNALVVIRLHLGIQTFYCLLLQKMVRMDLD